MIDEKKVIFCTQQLRIIEKEKNKRDIFYQHGIDLANYENEYFDSLINCLVFILGDESWREDLDWWLFDAPKNNKVLYVDGKEYNLNDAENFIRITSEYKI